MDDVTVNTRDTGKESVMTPSVAQFSRATTTDYKAYHTSNPNPQPQRPNYFGARDDKSETNRSISEDPTDILKFGKKISFGKTTTNEDVLEAHLQQMREKMEGKKSNKNSKIQEEREAIQRIHKELEQQDAMKMRSSDILKNEFLFFNDQKKLDNTLQKAHYNKIKNEETYDHFPFVSGEMLDQHRLGLGVELRADLKNYMIAKSQGLVGSSAGGKSGNRYSPARSSHKSSPSWAGSEI